MTPITKYRTALSRSCVPGNVGPPFGNGRRKASPTMKLAMEIRTRITAPRARAHQEWISRPDVSLPLPPLSQKRGAGRESFRREAPGTNHAHRAVPLLHDPTPPRTDIGQWP